MAARSSSPSDGASLGFRAWRTQPAVMSTDHVHGDLEVNFLLAGSMRYFMAGRFVELLPGRFAVFWGAMPHQLVAAGPGTDGLWVTIPIADFLHWHLGEGLTRRLLRGELVMDANDPELDRRLLERWADDLRRPDDDLRRLVALEVQARLGRLALGVREAKSPPGEAGADSAMRQVETMAAWLGAHYREDLAVDDVARTVGLHPNYAMNVFRKTCGMTIGHYLTHLRLSHAQRLLLTSDKTVLAVALDAGFGSLARFYAAFRAHCGQAPGRFRKAGHG